MLKSKETRDISNIGINAKEADKENSSEGEMLTKKIIIPNSAFRGVWIKDEGYSVGIENVRLTKSYETLNEALNEIGYGVEKDEKGDEMLGIVEGTNYEMVVRIVKALLIIEQLKKEQDGQENN